jgi:DNA-binding SARP family transcriptional activator
MALQLRLLGPLVLSRDGLPLALPASRKVRAILAYLALAPRATSRRRLCALFFETASDPRAELRWYLSKLRGVVGPDCLGNDEEVVRLDLSDDDVDACIVQRALRSKPDSLEPARARELYELFRGEFLEGLEIDHCPEFMGWVLAQRRRFRAWRLDLLERLVRSSPDDPAFGYIEKWLEIAPFDIRAHEHMFAALARRERFRERDEHLEVATNLFRAEGLDCASLRNAWCASLVHRPATTGRKPADHAGEQAYDFYLQGRLHLTRMMGQGLAASRRALEAAPRLAEAHAARAFVRSQSKEYDDAVREFKEAIELNPYLFDAYYFLARAAFARGDMQRAADMFRASADARPEDFQSCILLAMPLNALGKEDVARDALRLGIRRAELTLALNPGDGRALSLGAGALLEDDQPQRALEWAKRALELYPHDSSAVLNVALVYAKADERTRAMDLLDQVFARGIGKRDWVAHDPDYDNLRREPRFQRMVAQLK